MWVEWGGGGGGGWGSGICPGIKKNCLAWTKPTQIIKYIKQ
jgi:hypothetical protein